MSGSVTKEFLLSASPLWFVFSWFYRNAHLEGCSQPGSGAFSDMRMSSGRSGSSTQACNMRKGCLNDSGNFSLSLRPTTMRRGTSATPSSGFKSFCQKHLWSSCHQRICIFDQAQSFDECNFNYKHWVYKTFKWCSPVFPKFLCCSRLVISVHCFQWCFHCKPLLLLSAQPAVVISLCNDALRCVGLQVSVRNSFLSSWMHAIDILHP